mmetsp:Transcript_32664/g.104116  ORF Transcript_32664/g.104116 Transcript_32664/m.104116 type:complete len:367 (-) Transcript_32664:223-1323(-)
MADERPPAVQRGRGDFFFRLVLGRPGELRHDVLLCESVLDQVEVRLLVEVAGQELRHHLAAAFTQEEEHEDRARTQHELIRPLPRRRVVVKQAHSRGKHQDAPDDLGDGGLERHREVHHLRVEDEEPLNESLNPVHKYPRHDRCRAVAAQERGELPSRDPEPSPLRFETVQRHRAAQREHGHHGGSGELLALVDPRLNLGPAASLHGLSIRSPLVLLQLPIHEVLVAALGPVPGGFLGGLVGGGGEGLVHGDGGRRLPRGLRLQCQLLEVECFRSECNGVGLDDEISGGPGGHHLCRGCMASATQCPPLGREGSSAGSRRGEVGGLASLNHRWVVGGRQGAHCLDGLLAARGGFDPGQSAACVGAG